MSHAWMPLYVADYLADTTSLSTAEHGAYMLLIMHYWQHGGLPGASQKMARICRMTQEEWLEIRDDIAALFGPDWTHKRIDEELRKADELTSKRSAAGKAAADARYSKRIADEPANAVQTHQQTHTPTPTPSPSEPNGSDSFTREFDNEFWPTYPHHVQRKTALVAFHKARKRETLETIMNGLRRYVLTKPPDRHWLNPATFLNQERWNDEPEPNQQHTARRKQSQLDRVFGALAEIGAGLDDPGRGQLDSPPGTDLNAANGGAEFSGFVAVAPRLRAV
jgi:uncharacterized protein YdaU (DUF1376 family)